MDLDTLIAQFTESCPNNPYRMLIKHNNASLKVSILRAKLKLNDQLIAHWKLHQMTSNGPS